MNISIAADIARAAIHDRAELMKAVSDAGTAHGRPDTGTLAGPEYVRQAAQVIRLAMQIADEHARSEIELFAPEVRADGRTWYDLSPATLATAPDPHMVESLPRCAEYLGLRGSLLRNPINPHLVGFGPWSA